MRLLFVAVVGEGEGLVARERQYAACKAHTTRNAHQKRQQERKKARPSPRRYSTGGSCPKLIIQPRIGNVLDRLDCQPVERTPLFDEAVSFVRFYHDASWSLTHGSWLQENNSHQVRILGSNTSNQAVARDWLWNIFITNTGTFWSVVASILPILRPVMAPKDAVELEKLALEIKAESFVHLRKTLQSAPPGFLPSMGMIYHVKALLREAAMNGDLQGADIHAKMLMWLVEKLPRQEVFETDVLRIALWSDAIPALLQLRRPVIEYQHWMPRLVSRIWTLMESTLPDNKHSNDKLLYCISSQPLRDAIIHAHRALETQQACEECRLGFTERIFQWMITKSEYHICNMLNLYFDLKNSKGVTDLTEGARHTEAAVALALLHMYQKSFSNITRADGVDMHETAGVIGPPLRAELRDALSCCSPSEQGSYRDIHSWLLAIGESLGNGLRDSSTLASNLPGHGQGAMPLR